MNGILLGLSTQPKFFVKEFRKLRRVGLIDEFVSIHTNSHQQSIHIASDGGRICRPLIIVDQGVSKVTHENMQELEDGTRSFEDFLKDGLIEYLDVNEENDSLTAIYHKDIIPETTHLEIEPLTILGAVAGLIPYPHHNQSPRNT